MAHKNINARQAEVRRMLDEGIPVVGEVRRDIARRYGASTGAVYADVLSITQPKSLNGGSVHVTPKVRARIFARDKNVCQYCDDKNAKNYDVEHVLPAAQGGCAKDYNLVVACHSCNMLKMKRAMLPRNLHAITTDNPEWRQRILDDFQAKRKAGAQKRLDSPEKLSTNITAKHRQMLETYCEVKQVSTAEAVRTAIELLFKTVKGKRTAGQEEPKSND